ncbi:MAG: hypothetical protein ACREH3_00235, partial [Geminicoccales bacterium]
REAFITQHDRVYGYTLPDSPVEIQSIRLSAIGETEEPSFGRLARGRTSADAARKGARRAWFGGRTTRAPIYDSARLRAGNRLSGPALIEDPTTTIRIDKGWNLMVDPVGSYVLWRAGHDLAKVKARLSGRRARAPASAMVAA